MLVDMEPLFKKLSPMELALLWAIIVNLVCFSSIGASRSGCSNPLGLEDGRIKNSQLSSYTHHEGWDPFRARLNSEDKAWCSDKNDNSREYLQIDLLKVRHVSAIATQGVKSGVSLLTYNYYVEKYMIKYSYDGSNWFLYEASNGQDVTFTGNSDASGVKLNYFRDTFVTRFLRIYPKMFHRDMCLRVELYGCNDQTDDCTNFGTTPAGSITSLGFPDGYPGNKDCTWLISVSGNKKIALMFTQFDIYQGSKSQSCIDDFLEVRNGLTDISSQIGGKYCNSNRPMLMMTRRNFVRIYFHSGSARLSHKGFQMHYLAVTQGSEDVLAAKACDGSALALNCSNYDNTINILHAWYYLGSSPNSCGQSDSTSSSSCSAFDAKSKVVSKCQDYRECRISVSESLFGHGCTGATLQLEVFYQCTSTNIKTPPTPTPPPTPPPTVQQSTNTPSSVPPVTTNTRPSQSFTDKTTELPTQNPSIDPTVSFRTTTTSQIVVGSDAPEPTQGASSGSATPPAGRKEARTFGGMATGIAVGIIVVVIAVLIAALLIALFLFRKKRERKQRGDRLKSLSVKYTGEREYTVPDNSERKRCPLDYSGSGNAYQTVNVLYQSADCSNDPDSSRVEEDNAYASCPVDSLPKITENPLYGKGVSPPLARSAKTEEGYELVKPSPHEYASPSATPPSKVKSINNPNYETTLPFEQSHEYVAPNDSKC